MATRNYYTHEGTRCRGSELTPTYKPSQGNAIQTYAATSRTGQMIASKGYRTIGMNNTYRYDSKQQVVLLPTPHAANPMYKTYGYARTVNTPRYNGVKTYYLQAAQKPHRATETTKHYSAACTTNTNFTAAARPVANPKTPVNIQEHGSTAPETSFFMMNYGSTHCANAYSGNNATARCIIPIATSKRNTYQQDPSKMCIEKKGNTKTNILKKRHTFLYCNMCKISCIDKETFQNHCAGKRHKKREAAAKAGTATGVKNVRCEVCDVSCSDADNLVMHIKGAKHQRVVRLHTKLRKPIPSTESVAVTKLSAKSTCSLLSPLTTETKEQPNTVDEECAKVGEFLTIEDNLEIKLAEQDYFEETENNNYQFDGPNTDEMNVKGVQHRMTEEECLCLEEKSLHDKEMEHSECTIQIEGKYEVNNNVKESVKSNSRKTVIEESQQRLISSLESVESNKMAADCGGGGGVKRKNDGEDKSLVVKKVRLDSDAKSEQSPSKSPKEPVTKMHKQLTKNDLEEFIAKEIVAFLSDEHRNEIAELKARIVKLEKAKDYWKRQAMAIQKQIYFCDKNT